MSSFLIGAATAAGLGALTVVHPCPLTTNIAAVSLLSGWRQRAGGTLAAGLVFVLAEMLTFTTLGFLVGFGMIKVPSVANFLQIYLRQLLGPLLVIVGMIVAGILFPAQNTLRLSDRFLKKSGHRGLLASLILGVLIALSFCPMSAAIFFGVLLPLAISNHAILVYPALFGLGSGLPLIIMVVFISRSSRVLERSDFVRKSVEDKLRLVAGSVMILLGVFLSLHHVFGVL